MWASHSLFFFTTNVASFPLQRHIIRPSSALGAEAWKRGRKKEKNRWPFPFWLLQCAHWMGAARGEEEEEEEEEEKNLGKGGKNRWMLYDAAINLLDVLDHNAALLCSAVCGSSSRSTWYWESWCASAMAVDRGFFSSSSFTSLLPPPSPLVTWLNSPSLGLFRSFIGGKKRKKKKKKKKQNNSMRNLLFHFLLPIDSTTTARQCLSLYKMSLCVCVCVCVCVCEAEEWTLATRLSTIWWNVQWLQ